MANSVDGPLKSRFKMYWKIEKTIENILQIFGHIATVLLVLMMFVTVYHVVGRYFFSSPILGLTEISGFIITISIFLMVGHVMVKDGHVSVGLLSSRLGEKARLIMNAILFLAGLCFTSISCIATFLEGLDLINRGTFSPLLHAPYWIFTFVVCIGWGLLSLGIILFVINMFLKEVE